MGIVKTCLVGKIQGLDVIQKCAQRRFILPPPRRNFDSEQEFRQRMRREGNGAGAVSRPE